MANYNEIVNLQEVSETNAMIEHNNLDVRTITMGISLLDCGAEHVDAFCDHIYNKITKKAEKLVETGEEISREYGIPIVHKRISVTPIAIAGASACHSSQDFVKVAETLDRAAKTCGVNFLWADFPLFVRRERQRQMSFLCGQSRRHFRRLKLSAQVSMSVRQKQASIWMPSVSWER